MASADDEWSLSSEDSSADGVELGFCEAAVEGEALLFERGNWRECWDGGLAGGGSIPLVPCAWMCCRQAIFLAQIYAPFDEPASAFHRSLLVSRCRSHGARCIRQQLPRRNEFYSFHASNIDAIRSGARPRFEIFVESEPGEEAHLPAKLTQAEPLTQADLSPEPHDPVTVSFLTRVARAPSQVLRYRRAGKPLWTRREPKPTIIPSCTRCGAPRIFEFQLLPQLLYYLDLDREFDFGTLAIYTCQASCDPVEPADCIDEYVFEQPPICS